MIERQERGRGLESALALALIWLGLILALTLALPAGAQAKPQGVKTKATLSVFDEPRGGFILLGGLLNSEQPACKRGRVERYYRLTRGSKKYLGQSVSNRKGIGTLRVTGYRHGSYLVVVKKKRLGNGTLCRPTRAKGGLAGAGPRRFVRATASGKGWRKCGEFYLLRPRQPILFRAKRLPCVPALEIFARLIAENGTVTCLTNGCQALGYTCPRPSKGSAVVLNCLGDGGGRIELRAKRRRIQKH